VNLNNPKFLLILAVFKAREAKHFKFGTQIEQCQWQPTTPYSKENFGLHRWGTHGMRM